MWICWTYNSSPSTTSGKPPSEAGVDGRATSSVKLDHHTMRDETMSTQSLLTFLERFQSSRIRSPLPRLSPLEPRHPAGFLVSACVARLSHLRPELPVLRCCQTPAHRLVAVELVLGCHWTTRLEWVRCSAATTTSVPVATTSHRCPSSVNIESQGAISRRDKNIHIWRETACPKTAYPSRVLRVFLTMKRIRLARRSSYT